MRKMTLFLGALVMAAALSGCGKKAAETEAQTETQTERVTETQAATETETEPQTEAQTEKEDSMNKTRSLKGLVKSSDTSTLTIQTERGKELTFSITGADIQSAGGIQVGGNVTILYKGEILDTDTSGAKVLIVKDLESGETPVTEGELMTEGEEADPDAGAGSMGGSILDLNSSRIVILSDDGDSYYFSLYGTNIRLSNGMQKGNYVTVEYNGDIHGPDLVTATAIYDTEEQMSGGATGAEGSTFVSGTLADCTLDSITLTTDEGDEVTYSIGNATQYYYNGIAVGNYITLEISGAGEEAGSGTVIAVYDYNDNAAGQSNDTASDDQEVYNEESYDDSGEENQEVYDDSGDGQESA